MSTAITGCDYRNFGGGIATLGIDVAGMKAAGNQFVCEYLGRTENNGYLRAADVSLLAANGIAIVSIYERNPTTISYFTTANANADASAAMAAAALAGQTAGSAIYFTIDADFVAASDIGAIKQYFETINAYFIAHNSPYAIGAYGSGYELTALLNDPNANVKYTWLAQSTGWTGYLTFTAENIKQLGTTHPAWGPTNGVDSDVAYTAAYGQWAGTVNQAPVLAAPMLRQDWTEGQPLVYTVPGSTFTDANGDALTYAATLSTGAALPSWLTFNPASHTLTGIAPIGSPNYTVRVTVSDPGGLTAYGDVVLSTPGGQPNNGSSVVGTAGNDVLTGGPGNDTVDGGLGMDTAVYSGKFSDYSLVGFTTVGTTTLADNRLTGTNDGVDNLTGVERLAFADVKVALDLGATQSAGESVLLLGAVLPGLIALSQFEQGLMGTGISLFDQGHSMQELAGVLLDIPIWDILTGHNAATHTDVARYLLTNVNGVAPDAATLAAAVTALDTEPLHGQWLANLAASAAGQAHVGLVGLAQSGLAYL